MNLLFSPFQMGALTLSNRIVMAPMTRSKSPGHIPGQNVVDYYQRRAEGLVGLIITEGTAVGHKAAHGYPDVPNFYGKRSLEGWSHVVKQVHQAGGKIFPQLWHVGSVRQSHQCANSGVDNPQAQCNCETKIPGYAPSAVVHPSIKDGDMPHVMSIKDIQEVIQAFAQAAADAKAVGFDGVEIHGAHGYLIDQFFWERTNQRTDQYGGKTLAERTRFAVEIIEAIREKVGPDFPIDFRFSQWKLGDYDAKMAHTPEELEAFLTPLVKAGVDIFHCSTRRYWEPEFEGSSLNLAGWTKKLTGKPTITVGSVGLDEDFIHSFEGNETQSSEMHFDYLMQGLEEDDFSLVAVGRALLGDPYWVQKLKEGKFSDITTFSPKTLSILY